MSSIHNKLIIGMAISKYKVPIGGIDGYIYPSHEDPPHRANRLVACVHGPA